MPAVLNRGKQCHLSLIRAALMGPMWSGSGGSGIRRTVTQVSMYSVIKLMCEYDFHNRQA